MSERITFIGAKCVSETELREALKRIEEQPTHGWRAGDIFRFLPSGNTWRIKELVGYGAAQAHCLWSDYNGKPGSDQLYYFNLPNDQLVKLVEESNV